ncbi:MAG: NnrS family protein [Mariprofundaceae bacterium]|nr:NnrS family protein [Mariprofundaceae bacterium]
MQHTDPETPEGNANDFALFRLGFRPFFLAGGIFSVIVMAIWMADLVAGMNIIPANTSPMFWHAHEMIYGYALAIIAGFLLTAVKNWTGIQTLHGTALKLLLLCWLLARIAALIPGPNALLAAIVLDNVFIALLAIALSVPVIRAKLWKNMAVISKVYFLLIGNIVYALGLLGIFADGQRIGIFIGLYMILSLILVLSRRVIPMFIERGVGYQVSLQNHLWVDISGFLLFLAFAICDIFLAQPALTAWLAATLFILHSIRLYGWHTHGIWKKPLLWVLYLAYAWIILGFGLKFAAFMVGIPSSLALHAFAVGGIGMMTLGMISRVSLGHTGRNIMQPPSALAPIFCMLFVAAWIRVLFPLLFSGHYLLWIGLSQALWIAAFAWFVYIYAPILIRPRLDGRWG